jgi:hypothetical protein
MPFVQILCSPLTDIKNVPQGPKPSWGLTHGTAKAMPFVQILCSPLTDIKNITSGLKRARTPFQLSPARKAGNRPRRNPPSAVPSGLNHVSGFTQDYVLG